MPQFPQNLDDAIAEAKAATQRALEDGCQRVQIELVVPEIALQAQSLAWQFAPLFESSGSGLKILFADTGAAALAKRDWGEVPFPVSDIGTSRSPVTRKVSDDDRVFLVVAPSSVEVEQVEQLANLAGDRPIILLIPQLESISIVGIGYAARQLRDRFLSTIETSYYFKPFAGGAVLRAYPQPWQVWAEKQEGEYELIAEESQKPSGEAIERLLAPPESAESSAPTIKKKGFLDNLQEMFRALTQ